ncbi:MMPL family transporter [Dactylosporangium sp. NPDC005572]|uniref:MMPL family transporter n=1 Tax=Dactylosporangium sp. NPDC005572 TaxID=3156889 RepID=UPI00339DFC18
MARWIVVVSAFVTVLAGVFGAGVIERLSLNRFEAPGSESVLARQALAEHFGTGSPNVALLVTARGGDVDAIADAGTRLTAELRAFEGVGDAWSYWTRGNAETLRSADGRQALVLAWLPGSADEVRRGVLPELTPAFTRENAELTVVVGGGDEVFRQVMEQARRDFLRAELVILPLVVLMLWWVYRRIAAALVTLAIGLFAVAGSLALLRLVVAAGVDVSTFASNIALVMGIGLGVDYGLFMIFRYREELPHGPGAVARTVRSAGRTVVFSGATVAASVAVLFAFPFLSSFAWAGLAVVLAAVVGAVVVLPAALALLGRRVDAAPRAERFWGGVAARVVRRPVRYGGVALALLVLLGAPVLGIRFGLPDDRVLPASAPARQMYDQIRAGFDQEEADAVQIVAAGGGPAGDYAAALSQVDGVVRVDSADGSYVDGLRTGSASGVFRNGTATRLVVVPSSERLERDAVGLVRELRAVPEPFPVLVGGYPADLTDYRDGVTRRLPLVAGLIVAVTFAVLFLMTGSLVAPLKAAVLNALSLSVMFGALVFVFQQGHFSGLLGFTPTGSIEPSVPILMFCVAYGLSMDYEVFLLARIKESYDRTGDPVGSIPAGIARSAPLVTAAAAVMAVSFAAYATGRVVFLQQLGIGMALAVIADATLIRGLLAPALMRLAGHANWWAPAPLRRLHRRIGLREGDGAARPALVVQNAGS